MIDIFDRAAVTRNRNRHAYRSKDKDFIFDWAISELSERLKLIRRSFPVCVRIGGRGKLFLENDFGIETMVLADSAEQVLKTDEAMHPFCVAMQEDTWPFAHNSLDLVLGALTLHSLNDLPGALIQIRKSLKPDGLFHGAMLGGETLRELRECLYEAELERTGGVSPRIAPFADMKQMGGLMQRAGFALPVVDSEKLTVTYDSIFKLMHDLRIMGEGNALSSRIRHFTRRDVFTRAGEIYAQKFADADGRIRATFEIIFFLGWAPHEKQQKPLRPGSAKLRLADALGTSEIGTGEKP